MWRHLQPILRPAQTVRVWRLPARTELHLLGDNVDRSKQSLETICLLLAYKIKYSKTSFCSEATTSAPRSTEFTASTTSAREGTTLSSGRHSRTTSTICRSPPTSTKRFSICTEVSRLCSATWSRSAESWDRPTSRTPDCSATCFGPTQKRHQRLGREDRGVSFVFGPFIVSVFLKKLDLIKRAHQVVEDDYELFIKRQLVTMFSALNYCGEFDNSGAMISVDETLMCSFQILKPVQKKEKFNYGEMGEGRPVTSQRSKF